MREARNIVERLIRETAAAPLDVYGTSEGHLEQAYLETVGYPYYRTVRDLLAIFPNPNKLIRILEVGAYQGIVALALSKLGFTVEVFDAPDILKSKKLRERYDAAGILYEEGDLADGKLAFGDGRFDCVIICEVIEHLNFNPIPILAEINRTLKRDGYIYVGMPNQMRLRHRVNALIGRSIHEPVEMLFRQLCSPSFRVGLHWREYTMQETQKLLGYLGFAPRKSYYNAPEDGVLPRKFNTWVRWLPQLLAPSLKPFQVVVGQKEEDAQISWPPKARTG